MTDVFISYSRKDTAFVRKLFAAVETSGKDAWVDWENIPLTADWLEEIKAGIEAADSFIYVISPDSVHSEVCAVELGYALVNKKRLIPIMHRELVEPYDQAALHPTISSHNWLFFREHDDFDQAFQSLSNALSADLDHMRVHTRLLVKAKEWADRSRESSLLLRGADLQEAEAWLTTAMSKQPEPTELHTEFIMTSHNSSNSRQRTLFLRILFALAVSVVLAVVAAFQWQRANVAKALAEAAQLEAESARDIARREAEVASSLAIASIAQQTNDSILALALALAASEIDNPPGLVERALADVVYAPGVRHVYDNPDSDSVLRTIAYSPDESQFAVTDANGNIIIWDKNTVNLAQTIATGDAAITSIAYSQDGTQLLSAGSDGRVVIWDIATSEAVHTFDHEVGVNEAIFTANEARIFSAAANGNVYLWNIEDGALVATFGLNEVEPDAALTLALTTDNGYLAVGHDSGLIALWDAADPSAHLIGRRVHTDSVNRLVFSQDGLFLYSASSDESAYRLDGHNLRTLTEYAGHTNQVMDIDVSADGRHVVTSSQDRTVLYWDAMTSNRLQRLWAHTNFVNAVRFSSNGRQAISASEDGTAMEWDLRPGNILHVFTGHEDWIRTVDLSNDDTMGVSGSDDDTIIVWDIETEAMINHLEGHTGDVRGVKFTTDNSHIVSVSLDGTARVWSIADSSFVEYRPHGDTGIESVDVAADGERAISGASDGTVRVWNINTGEVLLELNGHTGAVPDVRFSPDGTHALSASLDSTVKYWNLETGEVIHTLAGHGREALSVAFSPDGTRAISGSRDSEFFYWDLTTGTQIRPQVIAHGSSVRGIDYSPVDNDMAISASADLLMFQWNLATGEVIREFAGHERVIYSVDFSSDGTMALSGSRDMTLILCTRYDTDSVACG
jgi:WD40 repeat protein